MKQQLIKIMKNDWCVSVSRKTKKGVHTRYYYGGTKKAALGRVKAKKGYIVQVFKCSYEFRDVTVVK